MKQGIYKLMLGISLILMSTQCSRNQTAPRSKRSVIAPTAPPSTPKQPAPGGEAYGNTSLTPKANAAINALQPTTEAGKKLKAILHGTQNEDDKEYALGNAMKQLSALIEFSQDHQADEDTVLAFIAHSGISFDQSYDDPPTSASLVRGLSEVMASKMDTVLQALLQAGLNVNGYASPDSNVMDGYAYTLLQEAIRKNWKEGVDILLQQEANVEQKAGMYFTCLGDPDCPNALDIAVSNNSDLGILKKLLPNSREEVHTRQRS